MQPITIFKLLISSQLCPLSAKSCFLVLDCSSLLDMNLSLPSLPSLFCIINPCLAPASLLISLLLSSLSLSYLSTGDDLLSLCPFILLLKSWSGTFLRSSSGLAVPNPCPNELFDEFWHCISQFLPQMGFIHQLFFFQVELMATHLPARYALGDCGRALSFRCFQFAYFWVVYYAPLARS